MEYISIFGKRGKEDDYTRYWVSVSTEKTDKKGKGTGEYTRASIPARLSRDAEAIFEDTSEETKTKGIRYGVFELTDCWFKAVEGEDYPFAVLFINKMKEQKRRE